MALIGILRNKMGKIVVGAIMVTMIAFIGTDLIGNSTILGGGPNQEIAEMAGETISNTQFQDKVDELSYNFALNTGRNPVQQEIEQIRIQAWNALLLDEVYQKQFEQLGLVVTSDELIDMVQGANITSQIKQFFRNQETGTFDKSNVTNFLASLQQAQPQQRNAWITFEQSLIPNRLVEKYSNLLAKTNYITKYEAQEEYINQNANFSVSYVFVSFLSVSDTIVSISENELKGYIDSHQSQFQRDETRSLEYVSFSIVPSAGDSSLVQQEIIDLREEIATAGNDSSFVSINSDDPYSFITYDNDNLPDSLQGKKIGYITEPAVVNGAYEFYKLSRIDKISADSSLYRVGKVRKDISLYISDETINEAYRKADRFAASVGNLEEFKNLAKDQGLSINKGTGIDKNAQRVGRLTDARTLVLWLYNEGEIGAISEVKEIGDQYIVAAMTALQEEGVANLEDVRNEVERKVRNEKKAEVIISKLNELDASDTESIVIAYGDGAKNGKADFQLFSNNITGIGYAPEVVGLSFALDEEEMTRAFTVQDGVVLIELTGKDIPEDLEDYSSYTVQVSRKRLGSNSLLADFPLSYFRIFISRKIDNALKEFAEIEDMRYKFF